MFDKHHHPSVWLRSIICAVVLLSAPQPAEASDWQLHGFLSQGFTISDGNNVNGDSSDGGGSFDFREAAVNLSWRPSPRILLAGQVASVRRGKVNTDDVALDYLLADYQAYQGNLGRVGFRAGKLKLPFAFFNESRDAVHSRPGILMPQSIYLDNDGARAFGYFSGWGAAVYGDRYYGRHNLAFELLGLSEFAVEDEAEISILRRPASGRFKHERGLLLRILDDIDGGRWRLALSISDSLLSYSAGNAPPFDQSGDFVLQQAFASVQHNREHLSLTAEIVRRRIKLGDLISHPAVSSHTDQDSFGFYLQALYRLPSQSAIFLRYDERLREMQDRNGHRQAAASGLPRHYFFGRDVTLGGNMDLTKHLGLWLELHLVDGVLWVNPLDNPDYGNGQAERHWSLVTAMLSYRF